MSCYTADVATFRILFPEFDPVVDATVQFYLDQYGCTLSNTNWGDPASDPCSMKPEAQLYASAHEIALSQNRIADASVDPNGVVTTSGTAGPMTSASAGSISASFGASITAMQGSAADTWWATTGYGQHFLLLKRSKMPLSVSSSCQPQI